MLQLLALEKALTEGITLYIVYNLQLLILSIWISTVLIKADRGWSVSSQRAATFSFQWRSRQRRYNLEFGRGLAVNDIGLRKCQEREYFISHYAILHQRVHSLLPVTVNQGPEMRI